MSEIVKNILTLVIFLAVIMLPIVIINRQTKRRKQEKMKQKLGHIASKYHLTIYKEEFLGHKIIALDSVKRTLIFADTLAGEPELVVDLDSYKEVKIVRKEHEGMVQSICLVLTDKNKQINVPFYESRVDNEMHLKQISDKTDNWQREIASLIKPV
ncbi:hypothetical protein [Rubrolithibacter danxiaensis]|uniref:hypothetical protein n=1 Tax=Rubrolithibacter danxiaensis TaxID=3390805 RepID=UPI003BF80777